MWDCLGCGLFSIGSGSCGAHGCWIQGGFRVVLEGSRAGKLRCWMQWVLGPVQIRGPWSVVQVGVGEHKLGPTTHAF